MISVRCEEEHSYRSPNTDSPKPLLDHVLLFSPVSGAHEGHGDGDLFEVRLDVLHGHFHGLADVPAKSDLPHERHINEKKTENNRRGVTRRTPGEESSLLYCTDEQCVCARSFRTNRAAIPVKSTASRGKAMLGLYKLTLQR